MGKYSKTVKILFVLVIFTFLCNLSTITPLNSYTPVEGNKKLTYVPHGPISITSDSDFITYGFPGVGTEQNPYLIDNYEISTSEDYGVYITGTSLYFTISNCYIQGSLSGIYIYSSSSTGTILNNTCIGENFYGIYIHQTDYSIIENNTCNGNFYDGIVVHFSDHCIIQNNTCSYNNRYGVHLEKANYCTILNNTCSNNYNHGNILSYSSNNEVYYDFYKTNTYYGIKIVDESYNNLIHHNTFEDNNLGGTSQAYDECIGNDWYDTSLNEGNFWSDWSGGPYQIDGSAGSTDPYPSGMSDITGPTISNVEHDPSSPTKRSSITFSASVTDSSGVLSVALHYRINNGTWKEIKLYKSGEVYSITFLEPFEANDIIEYYISAVDNSDNHNIAINDNSGLYFSFTVSYSVYSVLSILLPLLVISGILSFVIPKYVVPYTKNTLIPNYQKRKAER